MMTCQTFSLHTSTEINLQLWRKLEEKIEICDKWCHPTDKRFAVVLLNTAVSKDDLKYSLRYVNELLTVEKVKETSSILVSGGDSKITDFEDELCLLFYWKKNGGSPVKDVKKLPNDEFEVTFEGWDAVEEACKHRWTLNEVDLKVVPYFDCFIDRKAIPQKTYNDRTEIPNEYSRRFYPQLSQGRKSFNNEEDFQGQIDNSGKYYDFSLTFPGVKEYLEGDGSEMRRKIENENKCIFDLGHFVAKVKENYSSNFTVTLLGSVSVTNNVTVHLVQGNASDIKADGHLHINREMYRPEKLQERDLDCKLQEVYHSGKLVISVCSKLSKDLQLDVFAEMILRKIKGISKGKSKIHVFLCEADSDALLEAYKYTLLTEKDKQNLDPVDVEIWNSISSHQGSSIQELAYLKNKIEVVESLPSNFNTPAPVFVCVPIAQSLEPSTCPESLLKHEWRRALKNVSSNMKEDEISQFIVGATYKLKIPGSQDAYVYLYCTQDWGFGVSKAIAQSLESCLEVGHDHKNPELYIFPPGTYGRESNRYPAEFTVQRCLRELANRRDMIEKYNSVKLVVGNQQFYQAFKKCLQTERIEWKTGWGWNCLYSLKPESSIVIYGQKQACDTAYRKLKKHLDERILKYTFEWNINPKSTESIKQKISSESLQNVHVEINKGTLKCSGLSQRAIEEFASQIFSKPKSLDQADRPNSSSNEDAISLLKECCEKSKKMMNFQGCSDLNDDRRKEEFERKKHYNTQIHKSFWHRMKYNIYARSEDHRFDKTNSLHVKGKHDPLYFDKDPSKLLTSGRFDLKYGNPAYLLLCDVKCTKSAKKDGQIKLQYDECENEQIFPRLVAIVKKY